VIEVEVGAALDGVVTVVIEEVVVLVVAVEWSEAIMKEVIVSIKIDNSRTGRTMNDLK
jgi:hypothetical protein